MKNSVTRDAETRRGTDIVAGMIAETTEQAAPQIVAPIEAIRDAIYAALTCDAVRALDAAVAAKGAASVERLSARGTASMLTTRAIHDDHRMRIAARLLAAQTARADDMAQDASAAVDRAAEAARAELDRALAEPLALLRGVILARLASIEDAIDPLTELQAAFARRGLPAPAAVARTDELLRHVRSMRAIAGGR